MDTLVVDPFFRGMHETVFGCETLEDLFAQKDNSAFVDFELGRVSEAECFARYFTDRRAVDVARVRAHLRDSYAWVDGMETLCAQLCEAGVLLALCSNYPAPWADLVEETVGLTRFAPWTYVSGREGHRKPSPEAYRIALSRLTGDRRSGHQWDLDAHDVIFVDDSQTNCEAARAMGMDAIRFESADALRTALRDRGIKLPDADT